MLVSGYFLIFPVKGKISLFGVHEILEILYGFMLDVQKLGVFSGRLSEPLSVRKRGFCLQALCGFSSCAG